MLSYFKEGYVPFVSATNAFKWDDKGCICAGTSYYVPQKCNSDGYLYTMGRMEPYPKGCTYECVIKTSVVPSEYSMDLVSNQESGGACISINTSGKPFIESYYSYSDSTLGYTTLISSVTIQIGYTYYIVGYASNTTKKLTIRVICNELNIDTTDEVTVDGTLYNFHRAPICIGANPTKSGAHSTSDIYFNGTLYSARVYNKCLTEDELADNISYDKSRYGF